MKTTRYRQLGMAFFLTVQMVAHLGYANSPDPGASGKLGFVKNEYNLGKEAYLPPTNWPTTQKVEVRASVTSPQHLQQGPFPLLVFLHGRHAPCYRKDTNDINFSWPCAHHSSSLPNFEGYDYLAEILASQGFVVLSISANGITAGDENYETENGDNDMGMAARAGLIQRHLTLLQQFNRGDDPFSGTVRSELKGKIDFSKIGLMGHSRGGEGIVKYVDLHHAEHPDFKIKALLLLASTDNNKVTANHIPLLAVLPYCDGDVRTLEGVNYFDRARYNQPSDNAPKYYLLTMGANHNFYNTYWSPNSHMAGARDDFDEQSGEFQDSWCGHQQHNGRLTEDQQRAINVTYFSAFFRTYLRGEDFVSYLTGDALPPAATSLPPSPKPDINRVYLSYQAGADQRMDVNRFMSTDSLTRNNWLSGGKLAAAGLDPYRRCGGDTRTQCLSKWALQTIDHDPHVAIAKLELGWPTAPTSLPSTLKITTLKGEAADVHLYQALQFRASVNFSSDKNPAGKTPVFTVTLIDQADQKATVTLKNQKTLYYPPGDIPTDNRHSKILPKAVLNTVRLSLASFKTENQDLDLAHIRRIRFRFGDKLTSQTGNLLISDIAFAKDPTPPAAK